MDARVILDTGPFVALIDRRDPLHDWTVQQVKLLKPPFHTCEAVVAESLFLLQDVHGGSAHVTGLLVDGYVRLDFHLDDNLGSVTPLMAKYHDVPMSLADACLVRMSELHDRARVFTLDADFKLYRRHGRQVIPLIIPVP
ncbi:MAG: pilus assembly protein [Opitutus sp.]|nr:pilus assembly protein [Opitutus sp.]